MVVWKGEIERSHGRKAYNLDNTELEVPNFFVITSKEIKQLFESRDPQEILNKEIELEELKEAYKDVGMSSEVRNASSRARSLVGGQRDKSRVAIRVSDEAESEYELDVGSSSLENSLRNVVASYFEAGGQNYPNIIIQKMIEAEYTGALIKGEKDYIEVVEGLGVALEEGKTNPTRYKVNRNNVVDEKIPERQLKVTRNPMTGDYRDRNIREPEAPFEESELVKLSRKTSESIKFVYKRGSFFVVDRFEAEQYSEGLDYIQVSSGELNGVIGRDIEFSDDTLPPDRYESGLVARKGGYISTDAQRARKAGKPAIFGYEDAEEGMELGESNHQKIGADRVSDARPVTEIKTINELEREFTSRDPYLTSYADIFEFDGEKAVIDGRFLEEEALVPALEYFVGEATVLLERPVKEVLEKVVEQDFSLGVPSNKIESFEGELESAERKFMLEKLREL